MALGLTIQKIANSSSVEVRDRNGVLVGVYNRSKAEAMVAQWESDFKALVSAAEEKIKQEEAIAKSLADRESQQKALEDAARDQAQAKLARIAELDGKSDRTPEENAELQELKK